jgi:hypothetical protein
MGSSKGWSWSKPTLAIENGVLRFFVKAVQHSRLSQLLSKIGAKLGGQGAAAGGETAL